MIFSFTLITLGQFLNLANEPYDPRISPAIKTPLSKDTATIEEPVVTGALKVFIKKMPIHDIGYTYCER